MANTSSLEHALQGYSNQGMLNHKGQVGGWTAYQLEDILVVKKMKYQINFANLPQERRVIDVFPCGNTTLIK